MPGDQVAAGEDSEACGLENERLMNCEPATYGPGQSIPASPFEPTDEPEPDDTTTRVVPVGVLEPIFLPVFGLPAPTSSTATIPLSHHLPAAPGPATEASLSTTPAAPQTLHPVPSARAGNHSPVPSFNHHSSSVGHDPALLQLLLGDPGLLAKLTTCQSVPTADPCLTHSLGNYHGESVAPYDRPAQSQEHVWENYAGVRPNVRPSACQRSYASVGCLVPWSSFWLFGCTLSRVHILCRISDLLGSPIQMRRSTWSI